MINRLNPLQSRTGILLTILLIGVLGASLWKDRGLVFSPGPVTEMQTAGVIIQGFKAHADFEKECRYCHAPLEATLGEMCLTCHVEIANQMNAGEAIHGQMENAAKCQVCHSDHQGRDFNPTLTASIFFDHSGLQFSLAHHEADYDGSPIPCRVCHSRENYAQVENKTCQDCHGGYDQVFITGHLASYGENCLECHDGTDRMSEFDHSATGFALDKHLIDTNGQPIACSSCHLENLQTFEQQTCISCHAQADLVYMEQHQQQFGADCLGCHDGVDRMVPFDHGLVFPLDGRHAEIDCTECHTNQVFTGTPAVCSQCHAEPEIHAGVFGLACEACHTTTAWAPATLLEHTFPLGHGLEQGDQPSACIICHTTSYIEYTCYGCHQHQEDDIARKHIEEGISMAELPACVDCHVSGQEAEEDD